ncbi:MAG TPA: hypothetical protein VKU40_13865, partial [Thermoanaerobaculia bacterium]|nr:hypothetical protein [Thermoanaerobaculia bacterium]
VALELYGRKIRVDGVDVANVSGTGVHFLPSSQAGGQCWVNWLTRCHVGGCGSYALLNECSDSWFSDNYLSGSQSSEERSGGNSWIGNHFDNSVQAGLRVVASGSEGSGSRFVGNYFDKNPVGLLCTGSVAWTWFAVVSDNFFRANDVDIEVVNAQGLHVTGSSHRFGGRSDFAMKFQNCTGGLIDGCKFDPRYTRFTGKDASVKVRNCLDGNNLFEEG